MLLLSVSVLTSISESISISAVTVTEPKPRTAVFLSEPWRTERGFLEPSEYGFPVRRLCLYMVRSNELVQVRRLKVRSKSLVQLNFHI